MHAPDSIVAILHQASPPPDHGGIVKTPKPGGHRDSGADLVGTMLDGAWT